MSDTPSPAAPSVVLPESPKRVLLDGFPAGSPRTGGFAHHLVGAMVRAAPDNLLRLMRAFPVYGIALVLDDTRMVDRARDADGASRAARLRADGVRLAHAAHALRPPTYREQIDRLRAVLDPRRTRVDDRQLTDRDLARRPEFGA